MNTRPHLVLAGAGHTHVEVLRRQAEDGELLPARLTVISLGPEHHYSGMVPGYLGGIYREEEVTIDVASLARRAGAELVEGRIVGLDPDRRVVRLEDDREISYDLVSVAVGSVAAGADLPGVREHARRIKPLSKVVELRDDLRRRAREREDDDGPLTVAVVGGGAAGVEMALAVNRLIRDAGGAPRVTLYEAEELLGDFSERLRRRIRKVLDDRGLVLREHTPVAEVEQNAVQGEDGSRFPARVTVWLAGATAAPWIAETGLPTDDRGFLLVDRALRSVADPTVFAAGDCATLQAAPDTPKAGVYAVRHGPVLWRSLRSALGEDEELPAYDPQTSFLAILNTADDRAVLRYKGLVLRGRWAMKLKDRIDRRFMAKYGAAY